MPLDHRRLRQVVLKSFSIAVSEFPVGDCIHENVSKCRHSSNGVDVLAACENTDTSS